MLLKAIDIQGFKSFADKTTLKFGKGITAVVGPNGSGKSNISDAVRWVLGEQSSKTLRGFKMEDVVFGGTAALKPLGFAEVTLTIDNTDRHIDYDSDDVAVTRRYYRSGESEYRINRASVRLKDVHELFMDTGLGRDGYSMVGQGKIDDIVGTKTSEERRDIFEEAAGISRYRYRKMEAERKLKQAEENLTRLRDILTELEARIGPLAEQSEKAKLFLECSEEKRELEIGLWLHSLSKYKNVLRDQEYKIAAATAQYDAAGAEIEQIDEKIDALAEQSQRIIVTMDELRRTSSELEEAATRIDGEIAVEKNTIFHNGETIARIERELDGLAEGDAGIEQEVKEKNEQIQTKKEYINSLEQTLEQVQNELAGLMSENDGFSQKIEQLSRSLNQISAESADERVKMMTAHSAISEISARQNTIHDSISAKKMQSDFLQKELDHLNADLKRCEDTAEECGNALKGREILLDSRKKKYIQLKEKMDKLTLDEGEKRRRAQILEDLEKNMEGFAHSVKAIMRYAKQGDLRVVHGPVSRIFDVPQQYSTAIEIALGAAVQNIVVGSEEDAKHAISLLKSNNEGRATFLPISSINGRSLNESGLADCNGFIGLAVDLTEFDPKYSGIASSLLGRVAVAKDIDCATFIAKKYGYRFKVVTLDGQVINAGGSFTGGSLSKNTGLLSRAGEIERLRAQAAAVAKEIASTGEDYKQAGQELSEIEANILNAKSELTTAQEDKIRVLGEIRRVTEQISGFAADIETLSKERESAKQRIDEMNLTESAAEQAVQALAEKSSALEKGLETVIGGRDQTAVKREGFSTQCVDIKSEIFSETKDIEALVASVEEMNHRLSGQSGRREELSAEIESIRLQNANREQKIAELSEKAEGLRGQSTNSSTEIEQMNARRAEYEKNVQELRTREREKSSEREKLGGELARLEERKLAMVREYDDIIKKLYDEYELTRREAEETGITIDDPAAARKRLGELKGKIRSLGSVNVSAIEEYKEVAQRYTFMSTQINDIEKSREELYKLISQLTDQMRVMFVERFAQINVCFSKVFVELFGGGTAELKLSDPDNVLESGIEIIVQPPGKNISIIEQLSGGEKALVAISIYFAVMKVNPPPFCVLDEVDAALDDVNVTRFADYLRRMSDETQFIVITHRRGTMEEADMLYGVTMQEKGVSKLLELNVAELERELKIVPN